VQVHRVCLGAEVDDPPSHLVVELVRHPFGDWPGHPVDQEREARLQREERDAGIVGFHQRAQLLAVEAGPVGDHQYAIRAGVAAFVVHHECTGQLRVRRRPEPQWHAGGSTPVVKRTGALCREMQLVQAARSDFDR
jgi:hypothetical protein